MFTKLSTDKYLDITGDYSISIILLSLAIATFASFTAIKMNQRMQQQSFFNKNVWLTLASIAMGLGIWSMHFIGMGAYSMPITMHYDPILTFLSIIPAILSSFFTFKIVSSPTKSIKYNFLSSIILGLGIASMHYLGMASMQSDAKIIYSLPIFTLSILVAILVSFVAIYIFTKQQFKNSSSLIQWLTALLLGTAVSSMHYTGMFGTTYYLAYSKMEALHTEHMMETLLLNTTITIIMVSLLILLLLSSFIDQYVDYRVNYFEALTRLPNRRSFEKTFDSPNIAYSLAMWYIPDIPNINLKNGYYFGDKVIRHIGITFSQYLSSSTTLYQLQSRRFVFLCTEENGLTELEAMMNKLAQKLKEPFEIEGNLISLDMACAISTTDIHHNPRRLYTDALTVLAHPSTNYKYDVVRFDQDLHEYTFEQEIVDSIDLAILDNQLYMVYQPQMISGMNILAGAEALIRWKHPKHGMLSPAVFIPILERNQRMNDLTNWIIEQVCQHISESNKLGYLSIPISINIPGDYLTSPRLLTVLKREMKKYNIKPENITLEITETSVVKSIESAIRAISMFKEEGFSVALDDFGTGVSSLSYLKQLPISILKIDKSFIIDIPESKKDVSILNAIIKIGQTLELDIIIEGIETEVQERFLTETADALIFQGYYFARPMEPKDFLNWYQKQILN